MTAKEAFKKAVLSLRKAKVESPLLDAEVLLAHALGKSKEYLLAHPEKKLTSAQKQRFFDFVKRRVKREPVAYITGHKEFFGLDFLVNRKVLIPRPETEILVEEILKPKTYNLKPKIIDIGTGSGAIAITLAKHLPGAKIYATDVSDAVLRVARKNAKRHNVKVIFLKNFPPSHWEGGIKGGWDNLIIVANLPYLPTSIWQKTQPEIKKYEPRKALDGGPDGLKYYRQFFLQLKNLQKNKSRTFPRGIRGKVRDKITLFLEFDPQQTKKLSALVQKTFPKAKIQIKKDLSSRNRVIITTI